MPVINRETSALLVVDFQARLMPAIEDGAEIVMTEMLLFEWLATAEDRRVDRVLALVR
jgi:hypothetical protein